MQRWGEITPERFRFALKCPRDFVDPKLPLDPAAFTGVRQNGPAPWPRAGSPPAPIPAWVNPGRANDRITELLALLDPPVRYAVELRDSGWYRGATFDRLLRDLRGRSAALAWSYLTYLDVPPEITTDFVYLRFIGDHTTVPAEVHGEIRADRTSTLRLWADRIVGAKDRVHEILTYFNNHFAGVAPESINDLRRELGLAPIDYAPPARPPPAASPPRSLDSFDGARP